MVAGNWKMNGTRATAAALVDGVREGVAGLSGVDVVLCPPYTLIGTVAERLGDGSAVAWGAQDVDEHDPGAFTGAVAAAMLTDFRCRFCIVGHSERRTLYGESDAVVARKVRAVMAGGLVPIVCVGETLAEREANRTEDVVDRQLRAVLDENGIGLFAEAVVAYEPVWAIGTGRTASPDQAQAVHAFVRGRLATLDPGLAAGTRILYGGSVKPDNAAELFQQRDIDGGLIGGASLKAGDFVAICRAAA